MVVPHTFPAEWPPIASGRVAERISRGRSPPEGARIALVGLPDDLGVKLNGGRVGARGGPSAFRGALARYGAPWDAESGRFIDATIWDAGDVQPVKAHGFEAVGLEAALQETHDRITEALRVIHGAGMIPICIGGGHDLTFPAVRALAQHAGAPCGGVSIDSHLDVRATVGSGMPFRALIERGHVDPARFTVLAAGRFANAKAHADWLRAEGGRIVGVEEAAASPEESLRGALDRAGGPASFVSFDLDSIDASAAPGVSAPNPSGLLPREALTMARVCGGDSRVRHFDLMELNPAHDEQGRTARLAALLFLGFLSGFTERGS